MRKYIILSKKGVTTIQEVEIELVTFFEDVSISWLPEGEFMAKLMKPESLYEKADSGSLIPPIFHSHAFYSSEFEAHFRAEQMIRSEFERTALKSQTEFDAEACAAKIKEIKVAHLS